jgi:hypothetical protein
MIELKHDQLSISFPDVHDDARMSINFQRTLRIPDDGQVHYLPPGLGYYPLRHVDDFAQKVPATWKQHGGVMMPMWQSEAMWISFGSGSGFGEGYPCLVKIATGKINAVSGEEWREGAHRDPQDYVVVPGQPWLDGYCVKKGEIAQFVAMPLGEGYTAEEQITGEAEFGGLQIMVYPMKAEEWEKIKKARQAKSRIRGKGPLMMMECCSVSFEADMGLAPGGRMKQDIEKDPYDLSVWDLRNGSRVFVHLANSLAWRAITGEAPPTMPPTAKDYTKAGLPWFDFYGKGEAVEGSGVLAGLKTVLGMGKKKGESPLPENESFDPGDTTVVKLGKDKNVVREGDF